jgi:basic membrane lipoprotein Med (substrate-binding protein (PBP1-ABC) superfamily)
MTIVTSYAQPAAEFLRPAVYAISGFDFFTVKLAVSALPVAEELRVRFVALNQTYDVTPTALIQEGSVFLSGLSPEFLVEEAIPQIEVLYSINGVQFTPVWAEGGEVLSVQHKEPYKVGFIYHEKMEFENGWTYQQNVARLSLNNRFGDRVSTVVSENHPDIGPNVCGDDCDGPDGWCTRMGSDCAGLGLSHQCYIEGKRMIEQENVDMVVGVTFLYYPDLLQLSKEYPDKKFLITAPGTTAGLSPNYARGWLKRYQANYMYGYVLGSHPDVQANPRVGYVASYSGVVEREIGAFIKGLQEASGLDFTVYVTYVQTWKSDRRERIAVQRFFKYYNVSAVGTICNSFQPYYVAKANGGFSIGNNVDVMSSVGSSVLASALFSWEDQVQRYVGAAKAGIPWGSADANGTGAMSPPLYIEAGRDQGGWSLTKLSPWVPSEARRRIHAREAEFQAGHDDIWCGTLRRPDGRTENVEILGSNPRVAPGECLDERDVDHIHYLAGWQQMGIQDGCASENDTHNGFCYLGNMNIESDVPDHCPPGKAITTEGCVTCPGGMESKADACVFCLEGNYKIDGAAECLTCPFGEVSEQEFEAAVDKTTSTLPTTFLREASGLEECERVCATDERCVGFFFLGMNGNCWSVAEVEEEKFTVGGKYQFLKRQPLTSCTPCPPGTVAIDDARKCTPCAAGQAKGINETECKLCPEGRFQTQAGAEECVACSAVLSFSTSPRGSTSGEECTCPDGTYEDPTTNSCADCPPGMSCAGFGRLPRVEPGHWSSPQHPYYVFECYGDEDRCPGGEYGHCAPNRDNTSISCALCMKGYTPGRDGACKACDGADHLALVVVTFVLVGALVLMYFMVDRDNRVKQPVGLMVIMLSISQCVTALQQYGVIANLPIEWMEPIRWILDVLKAFTFNLEFLRPSCVANFDPAQEYEARLGLVMICEIMVLIIHAIVVMGWYHGKFRERLPSLAGVSGTLMLTFNLSIVSAMLAPFHCLDHPNDARTVKDYPSVLCWREGEQSRMITSGLIAINLPIAFFVACFWAVRVFPRRMKAGDIRFLRSFCFLFFRFRPEAYWYGPVILCRNCMFALAPVVQSPLHQAMFLQILMLISLCLLVLAMPWRVAFANFLDIFVHASVIVTLSMALVFVDPVDSQTVAHLGFIFIVCAFAMVPLATLYGTYVGCVARFFKAKRFQFFLCHHKAGAGAFARALKITLMGSKGVRGEVFLDSDNLQDLSMLFSYVANATETLVVLHSGDVLTRPWCVGEITTAHVNKIRMVPIMFPGITPPCEDFIDNFRSHVPDITCLTNHGVDADMVKIALRFLKNRQPIELRGPMNQTIISNLGLSLASDISSGVLGPIQDEMPLGAEVAILADGGNFEAMASAIILNRILVPHTAHDARLIPHILPKGSPLPKTVKKLVVLVTTGIFQQRYILQALGVAAANKVTTVLAIADQDFKFPTQDSLQEMRQFLDLFSDDTDAVVNTVEEIFTEVGVLFQTSAANEEILELKAVDILARVSDPRRRPLGGRDGTLGGDSLGLMTAVRTEPPGDSRPGLSSSAPLSVFRTRSTRSGHSGKKFRPPRTAHAERARTAPSPKSQLTRREAAIREDDSSKLPRILSRSGTPPTLMGTPVKKPCSLVTTTKRLRFAPSFGSDVDPTEDLESGVRRRDGAYPEVEEVTPEDGAVVLEAQEQSSWRRVMGAVRSTFSAGGAGGANAAPSTEPQSQDLSFSPQQWHRYTSKDSGSSYDSEMNL